MNAGLRPVYRPFGRPPPGCARRFSASAASWASATRPPATDRPRPQSVRAGKAHAPLAVDFRIKKSSACKPCPIKIRKPGNRLPLLYHLPGTVLAGPADRRPLAPKPIEAETGAAPLQRPGKRGLAPSLPGYGSLCRREKPSSANAGPRSLSAGCWRKTASGCGNAAEGPLALPTTPLCWEATQKSPCRYLGWIECAAKFDKSQPRGCPRPTRGMDGIGEPSCKGQWRKLWLGILVFYLFNGNVSQADACDQGDDPASHR